MSWIERNYELQTGEAGHQSYVAGNAIGVIENLIWYQLGLQNVVRSLSDYWNGQQYSLKLVCDVTALTAAQITALDSFMNGPNNTVIGIYPPRLLSPAITFIKIAHADMSQTAIQADLVGRGVGRAAIMYNIYNVLEYWADSAYSVGNKNQVKALWASLMIDESTGRPL